MALEPLRLHCDCPPVHEVEYDPTTDASLTGTVIDAIAAAVDADPIDLPPLSESIDPDALERIFEPRDDETENTAVLGFTVEGLNVFVRGDGHVRVCDPSESSEGARLSDTTAAARTD